MIPAWNAGRFLGRALDSALGALAGESVQLEVVDDCSTDDTARVAAEYAVSGVEYHRNGAQKGATGNFNECLRRARGRLVHVLHADDEVLPGFYTAVQDPLDRGEAIAAFTRAQYIDDEGGVILTTRSEGPTGRWSRSVETLAVSNRIRPPAIAVRRDAYEEIGGYREDLHHAADWEMWVRLAMHGDIWFVDQPLARYRVHEDQDTSAQVRVAGNITERVDALEMITASLPPAIARSSLRKGLLYSSVFAGRTAGRLVRRGEWRAALAQAGAAARCVLAGLAGAPSIARRGEPSVPQVGNGSESP